MMTKALLLDFDGTLADTAPGIVITMQQTFRQLCKPIPTPDSVRQTIGLPMPQAMERLGIILSEVDHAVDTYRTLVEAYEIPNIDMFPGVKETLQTLIKLGFRLAICTSRNIGSLDLILGKYQMKDLFETMVTNSDHLAPKPSPEMVLTLLDRMDISAEEAIVVGDTSYDILMGNNAGCRTVAVTYGNHSLSQLLAAHPNHIINRFDQIIDLMD